MSVAEQRPLPGDDGYLEALDQAHGSGAITAHERRARRLLHLHLRRVFREHPQSGDDDYLLWLGAEYDAVRLDAGTATALLHAHAEIVRRREDAR